MQLFLKSFLVHNTIKYKYILNIYIWLQESSLTDTTIPRKRRPGSNENEGVRKDMSVIISFWVSVFLILSAYESENRLNKHLRNE